MNWSKSYCSAALDAMAKLDASSSSTNFNTYYDFSIVDAVAQQLLYEIAKAPGCGAMGRGC